MNNPDNFEPNDAELRALCEFKSADETRESLYTLWCYVSLGGRTYVATDGHTMAIRRSGKHVDMTLNEIAKLDPIPVDMADPHPTTKPPRWDVVCVRPSQDGKLPPLRGINPFYVGRIGQVERAAGRRAADDYMPRPGEAKKIVAAKRSNLRNGLCAEWVIGTDPLDPWHWRILTTSVPPVIWEGVIMPRRV